MHKCLDAFELCVLAQPTPATDLTTIHVDLSRLQADVDAILEIWGIEIESDPTKLVEDTVLEALFMALLSHN